MLTGLNEYAIAELEELRAQNAGILQPEAIVDRARSANSALHRYFEWDDSEAAARYRIQQARQVIRAVVRIAQRDSDTSIAVRAYISLPTDRATHGGYRATSDIMDDETRIAEALRELHRTMARLRARYSALAALVPVFDRVAAAIPDAIGAAEH